MKLSSTRHNELGPFRFLQFHIDVARNSIDDFNPFHDPNKWKSIPGNSFGAPLVSIWQLGCLIEFILRRDRGKFEERIISRYGMKFCNYDYVFPYPLRANENFFVRIEPVNLHLRRDAILANHLWVGNRKNTFLKGSARLSECPLYLTKRPVLDAKDLDQQPDITYLTDGRYFLKRKFLTTANAKNFITSSLADQAFYFDETRGKISFPDFMPVSYIASALYEKGVADNISFFSKPMLHVRHRVSINRALARELKSNDRIHLLIEGPDILPASKGLGQFRVTSYHYACFGFMHDCQELFKAEIVLVRVPVSDSSGKMPVLQPSVEMLHD